MVHFHAPSAITVVGGVEIVRIAATAPTAATRTAGLTTELSLIASTRLSPCVPTQQLVRPVAVARFRDRLRQPFATVDRQRRIACTAGTAEAQAPLTVASTAGRPPRRIVCAATAGLDAALAAAHRTPP